MYSLNDYVPETEHERVKQALFDSGAGQIGYYEQCVVGKLKVMDNLKQCNAAIQALVSLVN